jgi:purine-nucleoside phosphorylase
MVKGARGASMSFGLAKVVLCLALLLSFRPTEAREFRILDAYGAYAGSPSVNSPADYVAWLRRQPQFQGGKLDHLPDRAVILHNVDVRRMLNSLGYADAEIEELRIGHTDPNLLFVVRPKSGRPFIINRGLPGAGGISTQMAELGALGVRQAIHIGTAGLLGARLPYSSLIIGEGSYKDGAAFLLASSPSEADEQITFADPALTSALERELTGTAVPHARALGFTSPVYYFQKVGLLKALLAFPFDSGKAPGYVEMEEAPFFVTARLADMKAASIVVGSDRAVPTEDTVRQEFFDGDLDVLLALALRHAIATLSTQH